MYPILILVRLVRSLFGFVVIEKGKLFASCKVKQRGIDTQLIGYAFVFLRLEVRKAEVAAVVPDVLRDLVVGLGEIDDAAVPVPTVDEIVDDVVLVFSTSQVLLSVGSSSRGMISFPGASMTRQPTPGTMFSAKSCSRAWYLF